ncbi:MAG: rod shape-determining protein RodA [Planctomycetota bacterium]|nr:MAG: rod shape-determining protein RodA [Planctomycetota bacterium]
MRFEAWMRRTPWTVVLVAAALMGLGLLGIARAEVLAESSGRHLFRQLFWLPLCLAAMFATAAWNYRILARYAYGAFLLSLALLVAVFFFPPVNGAHRWIRFAGVGLQPSEFAKVAFVVALARYLMYRDSYRRLAGLLAPLALVLVPVLLVLREPDLGTALVFLPVLFAMLFAAGARLRHLAFVAAAALALSPIVWSQMSREQKSRITALAEQTRAGERPTRDGYHLHQAKQLMALGGWTGSLVRGEAHREASAFSVPEPHTDSIAVVIGERMGLAGWGLTMALFLALAWRTLAVAQATREPFGRLVAIGVAALFATQVLINTAMLVGLLPITGLSLPLLSYGGSSLLANALALGLVVNIALRPGYEVSAEPFRFATS